MSEIAKTYEPSAIEPKWYAYWDEQGFFHADADPARTRFPKGPYTIVIPPPNVTGVLHMGHMLNNTIQDVLIRRKRMQGYNALWVAGTDHASIATEAKVVALLREQGITKKDLSREDFLKHAWQWKEKYGGIILQQLRHLGASCDWRRTSFTMQEGPGPEKDLYTAVIAVFVDLYRKGLIYRGERMVNWDPVGRTAVSDEEVIYKEVRAKLYHVRYAIEGTDQYLTVATTRPETILADMAVAVHPEDERYAHLLKRNARVCVPLTDRWIPVIGDEAVDREFGTGCLKVTPAHSRVDFDIYQRHPEMGAIINTLNEDGSLNEACGLPHYVGKDRFAVRKEIAKELDAAGLLDKAEDYTTSIGHSERTDAVIEDRLSLQWWVKMPKLAQKALKVVEEGEVKLIPGKFINTYRHWMENVKDWCISRQLWWGHRIPAWYLPDGSFVVAVTAEEALAQAQRENPALTAADLRQDDDVLDTWFSSWLWPIAVFDASIFNEEAHCQPRTPNEDLQYFYPTSDLVTAPEILFFWVARMIMAGNEWMKQVPFRNVYLTGIVRDKQGRKMSKSLGNSPDPLELIQKYGADGVRFGMLMSSPAGNDLLFEESYCEQGRNFANKIWNAFRLVKGWEANLSDAAPEPRQEIAAQWLATRIQQVEVELQGLFDQFRLSEGVMALYKLVWDDFCSWYLELVKPPFGEPLPRKTFEQTLVSFEQLVKLLHPLMPFLTEELWHSFGERAAKDCVIVAPLAEPAADTQLAPEALALLADMDLAREMATSLRALRAEKGIKAQQPLELRIRTTDRAFFDRNLPIVSRLVNLEGYAFVDEAQTGAFSLVLRGGHELYVPAGEGVDTSAEKERILKEIEYNEGFRQQVQAKLSNERFVSNAKADVVERERQKLADAEAKIAALQQSLAALG